jgi:hypothetical protein
LLAWAITSSLWVYPHSLSYFNELAGGPRGGPARLIHSNIDWGQDLLYLKRWLDRHAEASRLYLAYFGPVRPWQASIVCRLPPLSPSVRGPASWAAMPAQLSPGWYAVSVNLVMGYPHVVFDSEGRHRAARRNTLAYWQQFKPVATAGYSIYIYHITLGEANRVRQELGLPSLPDDWGCLRSAGGGMSSVRVID